MAWIKRQWNKSLDVFEEEYECGNERVHKRVNNIKKTSEVIIVIIILFPLFFIPLYYSSETTLFFNYNEDNSDIILEKPTQPFFIDYNETTCSSCNLIIQVSYLGFFVVDEYMFDLLVADRKECNSFVYINMMRINNRTFDYSNQTLNTFQWFLSTREHQYRIVTNGFNTPSDLRGKVAIDKYVIPCFGIYFYNVNTKENGTVFGYYSEIFNNKPLFKITYGSYIVDLEKITYNYGVSEFYANGIFSTKNDFPLLMPLDIDCVVSTHIVDFNVF